MQKRSYQHLALPHHVAKKIQLDTSSERLVGLIGTNPTFCQNM